ncbi:MAG: twitching motility response regulator PilH [Gammaproteobacteria bacterium]|nr:MAG: twitching motility response regulator PilH [Gammaproteobacteria bacterium]
MDGFKFSNLFARRNANKDRRSKPRQIPRRGTKILVVDDSKTVLYVLKTMLRQSSYLTLDAESGEEGLRMARIHQPDLIIMDVVMPGINGFQATRALRKDRVTADIPIIIMSGSERATEQFWVLRIGANDFLTKPFDRGAVFQKIEQQLLPGQLA